MYFMLLNSYVAAWNLSADMMYLCQVRWEKYQFAMFLTEEMLSYQDKLPCLSGMIINLSSSQKLLSEAVAKGHVQQRVEKEISHIVLCVSWKSYGRSNWRKRTTMEKAHDCKNLLSSDKHVTQLLTAFQWIMIVKLLKWMNFKESCVLMFFTILLVRLYGILFLWRTEEESNADNTNHPGGNYLMGLKQSNTRALHRM